jgi:hypothetical protein
MREKEVVAVRISSAPVDRICELCDFSHTQTSMRKRVRAFTDRDVCTAGIQVAPQQTTSTGLIDLRDYRGCLAHGTPLYATISVLFMFS